MVRNLIGNALRYTQKGGVLVGVRQRGMHLLVQVWDTGNGIAPQDQQRIFEDFVQLENPERNQAKGLGLGLAIVQRAARLLDSRILLASRVGKGSCFAVEVPAAKAALLGAKPVAGAVTFAKARSSGSKPSAAASAAQAATQGATQAADEAAKPLSDKHIILLDDDEVLRPALSEQLRAWGAHVSQVGSLEDLDELLQRVMLADLLLTDHRLPDGNGQQAIRMAQERFPDLGTVVITGDTGEAPLKALQECHAPVLHKPFPAEALLKAIEQQLRQP
jgi:CheY-like chemotaxis protein